MAKRNDTTTTTTVDPKAPAKNADAPKRKRSKRKPRFGGNGLSKTPDGFDWQAHRMSQRQFVTVGAWYAHQALKYRDMAAHYDALSKLPVNQKPRKSSSAKLRDKLDLLAAALRKLGVDPDNIDG